LVKEPLLQASSRLKTIPNIVPNTRAFSTMSESCFFLILSIQYHTKLLDIVVKV
jgi:hypothetical protein